jgi:hypothetical protein
VPVTIVVLNNRGIGRGMPEIPDNSMFNSKPSADRRGRLRGALDDAMNFLRSRLLSTVS